MVVCATKPSTLPSLGQELAALARKHGVPGAQLAIHGDGQTVTVEVGELEYRTGRAVTHDTAFAIGSVTKSFTATMAMILVADGDLELDAPISEYLRGLGKVGDRLTLRCLLSHTGGLAEGPASEELINTSLSRYVMQYCSDRNLVLPPGTGFSYSNIGYAVVGQLISAVTGMSWAEAVESVVLRPLGIEPAFIGAAGTVPPARPIAVGHSVNTVIGRTRPAAPSLAPAEAPAGALAMSAVDLVALGLVHVGGGVPQLLPATHAAQMRSPVPNAEPYGIADGWGLGLAVFREGNTEWVGHDGNVDGASCYLRVDPASGWIVALTSNANTGAGLWQDLLVELERADVPVPRVRPQAARRRPVAPPPGCIGTYVNGEDEYVVADKGDGHLYLALDSESFLRMTFYEDLGFSVQEPASGREVPSGRFLSNPTKKEIHALQFGGRIARRRSHPKRPNAGHFAA